MAAFTVLSRLVRAARAVFKGTAAPAPAAAPELWCRPATVLALRDPERAPACLSGWH